MLKSWLKVDDETTIVVPRVFIIHAFFYINISIINKGALNYEIFSSFK